MNNTKEILFRKAKQLNVDMDEFEMELKGRLSEIEHKSSETANQTKQKTTKCPNCGSEIPSLSINCEFCGFEIKITIESLIE